MENYLQQLNSLKTAKIAGKKAPHKPILILSIIDLIERGVITSNNIELSDALVNTFKHNWARYVGGSVLFRPVVGTPFWHLQNEPFWKLVSHNGVEVTKDNVSGAKYSVGSLRKNVAYAEIDKELFESLQSEDIRAKVRVLLITSYLNNKQIQKEEILPMLVALGSIIIPLAS